MNVCAFTTCENVFTHKCNGEVASLIHVAERYGILMEKARARIETVCKHCKNFSQMGKNSPGYVRDMVVQTGATRLSE